MKVNFSDYAKKLLSGEQVHNFSEDYTQEDIHDADKTGDEVTAESLAKHAKNCEDAAACAAKCGNAELARRLEDEAKELTKESDKLQNQMINTETKEFATASEIPSALAHEGKRIIGNAKQKLKDIWDNSAAKASYEAAQEANKAREERANAEKAKRLEQEIHDRGGYTQDDLNTAHKTNEDIKTEALAKQKAEYEAKAAKDAQDAIKAQQEAVAAARAQEQLAKIQAENNNKIQELENESSRRSTSSYNEGISVGKRHGIEEAQQGFDKTIGGKVNKGIDWTQQKANKAKDWVTQNPGTAAGIGAAGAAGLYGLYKLYNTLKNKKNKTPAEVQQMNDIKNQYLAKKKNFGFNPGKSIVESYMKTQGVDPTKVGIATGVNRWIGNPNQQKGSLVLEGTKELAEGTINTGLAALGVYAIYKMIKNLITAKTEAQYKLEEAKKQNNESEIARLNNEIDDLNTKLSEAKQAYNAKKANFSKSEQ